MVRRLSIKKVLWIVVGGITLVVLCFVLPPIIRALRNLAKGGASASDAIKSAVEGISDESKRLLAAVGIGDDPHAPDSEAAQAPPITNPWNVEYFCQFPMFEANAAANYSLYIEKCKRLYNSTHWYGYDTDEVKAIINECGSKAGVSYMNYLFTVTYKENIPHWLLHGYWVRMSNKEFEKVDGMVKELPET